MSDELIGRARTELWINEKLECADERDAVIRDLVAEVERLREIEPKSGPSLSHSNDASRQHPTLPRYKMRWNGSDLPMPESMGDGYWTPFHLALAEVERLEALTFRITTERNNFESRLRELASAEPVAWIDAFGNVEAKHAIASMCGHVPTPLIRRPEMPS